MRRFIATVFFGDHFENVARLEQREIWATSEEEAMEFAHLAYSGSVEPVLQIQVGRVIEGFETK